MCKFCGTGCAIEIDVIDDKLVAVRGDRSDPLYGGYTCIKGRQLAAAHNHPDRLIHAQRRRADGRFEAIGTEAAIDQVADRLKGIIAAHGPEAVALYAGTYGFLNSAMTILAPAFQAALGSRHFYTSLTIDQPAKFLCAPALGRWGAGFQPFADADVAVVLGNNVLVSHYNAPGGVPGISPSRALREAQARGLKLVVVDPRRTEVADRADLHVQIRPGTDAVLLAGMLNVIFAEGLHDAAFCAQHVDGVQALEAAVADFAPERVATIADIPADQVVAAARMFGRARRGTVTTGTGPEMAADGLTTELLALALNIVCGRVVRAGEPANRQPVLLAAPEQRAEALAPSQPWGEGCAEARFRGLTALAGQMPCSVLADEILTPGARQVRALIVIGGNPVMAFPDQDKIVRALDTLDLLVCVDNRLSQSARRAHYVIAPSMSAERDDASLLNEMFGSYERQPYAFYMPAAVSPPGGTIDETEFLRQLARRLGLRIALPGGELPTDGEPSKFELLELMTAGGPISLAEVREATRGGARLFEECRLVAAPGRNADARFDVAPAFLQDRLKEVVRRQDRGMPPGCTHRYVARRVKHFTNSVGHDIPALRDRGATNLAYLNPFDLEAIGAEDGDMIEISTPDRRCIRAIACAAEDLKPGVVSISHGFGDPDARAGDVARIGSSTNRLVNDLEVDSITGMPRLSAIPVSLRVVGQHEHADRGAGR